MALLAVAVFIIVGALINMIGGMLSSSTGALILLAVVLGTSGLWAAVRSARRRKSIRTSTPLVASRHPERLDISSGMRASSSDSRFVEILPGGKTEPRRPTLTVSVSYETGGTQFLKAAQRYHDREESIAQHVPFMHYWPTYGSMDSGQQRWYFYWRSQVRRGNYPPTDLSYIFIHIYELLNLVECADPVQAAGRIWVLWQKYRPQHPKLDNYLPEWGGDLLAVKKSASVALVWWEKSAEQNVSLSPVVVHALVHKYVEAGKSAEMPYRLWAMLTDYRPRNKFYQEYNNDGRVDQAYEKAIRVAAQYWQRTSNRSLLENFTATKAGVARKQIFVSALVGYDYPQTIDLGVSREYLDNSHLSDYLTSVVKYAENLLRKQEGFSRKLSGIKLEPELAQALDAAFAPASVAPEPVRITIDHSRVVALHEESKLIGSMLEVLPTEDTAMPPAKPLHTDLAEVRQLWSKVESPTRLAIAGIYRKEVTTTDQLMSLLAKDAILPSVLIDRVNECAISLLGDRLIYEDDGSLSLAEDFLDELDIVIAESPPERTPESRVTEPTNGAWERLFAQLLPVEIALISLFADRGELTESEIDAATRAYHVMANAAIDGLSEKAVEVLGRAPIYFDADKWVVEDDDLVALRVHLSHGRTN